MEASPSTLTGCLLSSCLPPSSTKAHTKGVIDNATDGLRQAKPHNSPRHGMASSPPCHCLVSSAASTLPCYRHCILTELGGMPFLLRDLYHFPICPPHSLPSKFYGLIGGNGTWASPHSASLIRRFPVLHLPK